MKIIHTNKAPEAIGPYSQAIKSQNLLFGSGQIGLDPKSMELLEGLQNQVNQVCKNIGEVLSKEGLLFENVVKTTIYLTDINTFSEVNEIYKNYFIGNPARSTIEVSSLPKGAFIEIDFIAEY